MVWSCPGSLPSALDMSNTQCRSPTPSPFAHIITFFALPSFGVLGSFLFPPQLLKPQHVEHLWHSYSSLVISLLTQGLTYRIIQKFSALVSLLQSVHFSKARTVTFVFAFHDKDQNLAHIRQSEFTGSLWN